MNRCPMAALERTMKIQEVNLRALAKKITWWQADGSGRNTGFIVAGRSASTRQASVLSAQNPARPAQVAAETAMSERRWKRSMLSTPFMTPAVRQTNVSWRSGSTQKRELPAP